MKVYLPYFGCEFCGVVYDREEKAWAYLKEEWQIETKEDDAKQYSAFVEECEVL